MNRRPLAEVLAAALLVACAIAPSHAEASSPTETGPERESDETRDGGSRPGNSLIPLPFVFYTPETKTGGGVAVTFFFRAAARDSSDSLSLAQRPSGLTPVVLYTQRRQFLLALGAELYLARDRYRLNGGASFADFPDKFYGVGNDAPESAEEDFRPRSVVLDAQLLRRLAASWYGGVSLSLVHRELREIETAGLLASGDIPGVSDGTAVGAGFALTRDTRPSSIFPRSGGVDQLVVRVFDRALGSDREFGDASLDLRRYRSPSSSGVIALQLLARASAGSRPFDLLPGLGGQNLLRGYYQGRYRDRHLVATQVEYRSRLWRRLGGVVFGGIGQVAHDAGAFALDGFRGAAGLGLRFLVDRREGVNLRADWGAGESSSGFYLSVGEAF